MADDVFEEEVWTSPDRGRRPVYFFHLADDTVWGATARVLLELLDLVARSENSAAQLQSAAEDRSDQ